MSEYRLVLSFVVLIVDRGDRHRLRIRVIAAVKRQGIIVHVRLGGGGDGYDYIGRRGGTFQMDRVLILNALFRNRSGGLTQYHLTIVVGDVHRKLVRQSIEIGIVAG